MSRIQQLPAVLAALVCLVSVNPCQGADRLARQTLDANGVRISYSVKGEGEPVVLIHGWLSSAAINWGLPGITAVLAKDYKVVTFDVRGHGQSDKPTREDAYGPELVNDVVRLLDHLKIAKAHIVGYSMGGIIAGNFIAKHPDRVLSGTLGGMGWLKTGEIGQWGFSQIGRNDPNADALAICGRSLAKLALTEDEIKSIKVPITILVGDQDDLIKKLYVEPLKKVRNDWQVSEIKNANHISCILRPQFRDEIVVWLKKNAREQKPAPRKENQAACSLSNRQQRFREGCRPPESPVEYFTRAAST